MRIAIHVVVLLGVVAGCALAPVASAEDAAPIVASGIAPAGAIPPFCVTLKCPPDACGAPSTDCGNVVVAMWDEHFANCGAPPTPAAKNERMCGAPMPANAIIDYYAPSVRWVCCTKSPFALAPAGE